MAYSQYGIGVTKNRFELFDDEEDDPLEVLKKRELEKEARKKTKLSEKENTSNTKPKELPKSKQVPARKITRDTQSLKAVENQKSKEETQVKGYPRQQAKNGDISSIPYERSERQNFAVNNIREERIDSKFEKPELRDGGNRSGRGTGRGGGRGSRRGVFDLRGKREFERQSGSDKTGVKAVEKREGGGAHNWGTHKDDLEEIQDGNTEDRWNSEKPEETTTEPQPIPNETEEGTVTNPEDSARVMTLDEWKALKMPRQKPTYNLRKAGEGEDLSQWKKMYALEKKKEGEEDDDEDDEEYEHCEYPQRVGRQKHILDIDIRFKDARVNHGRGGRGMSRGVGRTYPRPGGLEKSARDAEQKELKAPKVDDEHDFPSLG